MVKSFSDEESAALADAIMKNAIDTGINFYRILENGQYKSKIKCAEEVFATGYDTAGNYHWTGTITGEHVMRVEENDGIYRRIKADGH